MVIIIFGIAFLTIPAVFLYRSVAHPSQTGPHGSRGTPICLWPLLICVFAVAIWHSVQAIIAQFRGVDGKEQWLFANGQIAPPVDELGYQLPPMAADFQSIRAGLNVTGGKWVVDFCDGGRNLYLGPFDSKALAQRCEAELRRLRPGWFSQQAGIAVLSGFMGQTRINGYKSPPEPVVSFEPVVSDAGECRLQLRRDRGLRPWVYFIMFWLCLWLAGEIFAVWKLLHDLTATFNHVASKDSMADICFLLFWCALWTLFGLLALSIVTMGLKRTEVWKFTRAEIIAGRSWHSWSERRLPIDHTVQVRYGPFAGPPSVDFISGGLLLHLGPFETWDLAGEAMGDVQRQFPHWHWPGAVNK